MFLSIVIPAYNEGQKIERDLREAVRFLSEQPYPAEILVVNDGSLDNTAQVVTSFIEALNTTGAQSPKVQLLSYEKNRGKGHAVRYGMLRATGEYVAFADAGLCVPLHFLNKGIAKLKEGYDLAIASRRVTGSQIRKQQPAYRVIGSQVFWWVIQKGMGVSVSDTQCGFKVYTAKACQEIFSRVQTDGFMFDVEAFIIADKLKLKVGEFPIEWSNDSDTRYHPVWGTLRNMKELIRIRTRRISRA